jgi:hypothetical protein
MDILNYVLIISLQELTCLDNIKCHSPVRRNGRFLDLAYLSLPEKLVSYVGSSVQEGWKNCWFSRNWKQDLGTFVWPNKGKSGPHSFDLWAWRLYVWQILNLFEIAQTRRDEFLPSVELLISQRQRSLHHRVERNSFHWFLDIYW